MKRPLTASGRGAGGGSAPARATAADAAADDRRVAAGLAANAVGVELMMSLWARGMLSDAEALAIATAAVESLRRADQAEPHPAWQGAQDLVWELATRFDGAKAGMPLS